MGRENIFTTYKALRYRNFIIIWCALLQVIHLKGQIFTGHIHSNYSGINALSFNPAASINTRTYLEICPISGGFALDNTFLFFHQENFRWQALLKRKPELPVPLNTNKGLDYRNNSESKVCGHFTGMLNGPSIMFAGYRHAVAITSSTRGVASTINLPYDLAVLIYEGLKYQPLYERLISATDVYAGELAWSEINFNYSLLVHENRMGRLSAGANLRKIFGISGSYIDIPSMDLMVIDRSTVNFQNVNASIGYCLPLNYDNNHFTLWDRFYRGSGYAGDFGVIYRRNRNVSYLKSWGKTCEVPFEEYLYKIGLSVTHIGKVSFNDNSREHRINEASALWQSIDTLEYSSINQLIRQINEVFFHDPDYSLINGNQTSIPLPVTLNFHGEVQYYPGWYLSAAVQSPLKLPRLPIRNPSAMVLSVRYESEDFEFLLPFLLYRFQKPYAGFYLRYKYLGIGCHRPEKFLKINRIDSADLYFSLNLFFEKGKCVSLRPQRGCTMFGF